MSISHVRQSHAQLRAVLFDIDDTLIDWSQRSQSNQNHRIMHLGRTYRYALDSGYRMNAPESTFYEIALGLFDQAWSVGKQGAGAPHIGTILRQTFMQMGIPAKQIDLNALLRAYDWQAVEGVTLFPDVPDVLPVIRAAGLKTGLITNSGHPMWMRDIELSAYGLLEFFPDCRFSAADVGWLKPYPAIFETALNCLGVAPEEAVFVGDEPMADVVGAQSIGMRAVLRLKANLMHVSSVPVVPDGTIRTFHDLLGLLDGWYPDWRPQTGKAR
jgi:putative hydrolase of the HAD superfamily